MNTFSSNSNTLNKIQNFTAVATILGLFYFDFTIFYIALAVISFYVYSIFGLSMTMHRYYTHKSFEMNPVLHWLFTFIAVLTGRGSPLGWVYIHRLHHAFSDTDRDPHGPKSMGFKLFGFKPIESTAKPNLFIVKELMTPSHLFINKYYLLIIIVWLLFLGSINLDLIYFTWILPVFCVQLSQNCFNHFAHTSGYRNFNTKDSSTNNIWLWPFILGDAWHNNHHANAEKTTTKIKRFELDPVSTFIKLIKK
jgi:stearoyl-CoA desaturase (delta-9 desaturase)